MSTKVSTAPPPPTALETEAQQAQLDVMRKQLNVMERGEAENRILAPYLYQMQGLNPQYDERGNLTGLEMDPQMAQFREQSQQIEQGYMDRVLAAQRGELPVNPALLRDLEEQEQILRQQMFNDLGPGGEFSTAGSKRMSDFMKRKSELLEGARRDDLSLAEQLGLSRQMGNEQTMASQLNRIQVPSQTLAGVMGLGGGVTNTAGGIMGQQLGLRRLGMDASMANVSNTNSLIGAGIGAAGTMGGMFLGGSGFGAMMGARGGGSGPTLWGR